MLRAGGLAVRFDAFGADPERLSSETRAHVESVGALKRILLVKARYPKGPAS